MKNLTTAPSRTALLGVLRNALNLGAVVILPSCSMTTNVLVTKDVVTVNAHAEITEKILDLLWFLP